MKVIALTQSKYALVDDDDFDWLSQWKWCVDERKQKRTSPIFYAVRRHGNSRLPGSKKLYMHKELAVRWGLNSSNHIDHKDGNGLNNQRDNIRSASHSQNLANQQKCRGFTSKFKGVCWFKATQRWAVCIKHNGQKHHLGYFQSEESAAKAYDSAAKQYFGEFARLNLMTDTCARL